MKKMSEYGRLARALHFTTDYGEITVEDTDLHGEPVRYYRHNGAFSSGMFLSGNKRYELVFEYLKKYEVVFEYLDVKRALMIGGAAYQYPKYYISRHPDSFMDVVEIDPTAEKLAREYFGLEELYAEYDLYRTQRLRCITADARSFLTGTKARYDVIFNDAFSGAVPVRKMATLESAAEIKEHLVGEGFYLANIIGSVSGPESEFMRSMIATTKRVFREVAVLYCSPEYRSGREKTNYIVLATDKDISIGNTVPYRLSRFERILRDKLGEQASPGS